jgi:hypothetical protein
MPNCCVLGEPAVDARFYSLTQIDDAASSTRHVSCEVRALRAGQLADALDDALRSVTVHAALTEAVLETRAVRLAEPTVPVVALVEDLARQLWNAGLPVSFGPSWTPAPDADLSVGIRGLEGALEAFLRAHPTWRGVLPDPCNPVPTGSRLDQRGTSG